MTSPTAADLLEKHRGHGGDCESLALAIAEIEQAAFRRGAREALSRIADKLAIAGDSWEGKKWLALMDEYADPPADEKCPDGDACPDAKFHTAADEKSDRPVDRDASAVPRSCTSGGGPDAADTFGTCPLCGSDDPKVRRVLHDGCGTWPCDGSFHEVKS